MHTAKDFIIIKSQWGIEKSEDFMMKMTGKLTAYGRIDNSENSSI